MVDLELHIQKFELLTNMSIEVAIRYLECLIYLLYSLASHHRNLQYLSAEGKSKLLVQNDALPT